ncbi:MFS transporter [Cohnella lubricantis]|uniref:MFS transporter n=1 Tax=Cohnella lubricantis TaxID=2163172 RepID=A0A841TDG5_9BACL|nr:MFS transporter [Cohnella lubricantis]MBB6678039.1 MFS transporter [Cohnella lubricantis]MBP2120015.1 MFS family permease [Cohnella lubricantis]
MDTQTAAVTDEALHTSPGLSNFLKPLRQSREFTLLWLGQWVAILGSTVTTVILPLLIYSITGSTTVMGLAMTIYMLPNVLVLPFSGWLVDRVSRIRLLLITNGTRFVLMSAACVTTLTGNMNLPLLFAGLALYGLMDGIFNPAYSALRAQVLTPDIRNAGNALSQICVQAVRLLGPPLGGIIVSFTSAGVGFGVDSVTYLISFACFWMLSIALGRLSSIQRANVQEQSGFLADFIEGFAVLRRIPWLWITILAFCFINICYTGVIAVLVPWLFKIHHGYSPFVYGLAMAGTGAGAILGAIVYGSRQNWKRRGLIAYGGAFLSGLALVLLSVITWTPGLILIMVLEGFGIILFAMIWETSLQELVPTEAFGRVASLDMLGSFALLPVGYMAVGALADRIGGLLTIQLFGLVGMGIVAAVLCMPSIRRYQ